MKNVLLKILCLVLALFMAFSAAGCGGSDNQVADADESEEDFDLNFGGNGGTGTNTGDNTGDSTDTDNQGGATSTSAIPNADSLSFNQLVSQMPKELRGTTLRMYNWNPAKEYTGSESVISKFEQMTGIKVQWEAGSYDDYDDKIASMINAGNSPDLIRFRDPNIHRMYFCDDIKTATGFDCTGDVWDKKLTKLYTVKGKIYAVNLKNTLFQSPMYIIYRKSIIDKYDKLEDPYVLYKNGQWTWNKFIDMCKTMKGYASTIDPWRTNTGVDYLYFTGNSMFNFDGSKYTNNLGSATVSDCIKKMCDYRAADYTKNAMRLPKDFESGGILFMTFSAIATRRTNTSAKIVTAKADDDLYCVPIPSIQGVNCQWFAELEAYGVCKGAKNGSAAYYFLRYFLDEANYDANTFFCNKQAYDVYKACMAKSEYFVDADTALLDVVSTGGNLAGLSNWVCHGGSFDQFATERDSVMPQFNLAVKKANEVLAKFK